MRILVCSPGSTISTSDVFEGVVTGLAAAGCEVITYSLHGRLRPADKSLHAQWRVARKRNPDFPRPTVADISYQSTLPIFEKLYRFEPEVVLFVSGVLVIAETFRMIRKRHTVGVLLTESPYLMPHEQRLVQEVDIAWTNERAALAGLRIAQPCTQYLPHAWLPGRHDQPLERLPEMPAHDVVFVGTGFQERIDLLERVDWTGIDLGLYGNWQTLGDDSPLRPFVHLGPITNEHTTALYRRAKIGLNLYRTTTDGSAQLTLPAESLNPRAYELAACGVCSLSTPRAEVTEKFGAFVPTFRTATELTALLQMLLVDDEQRVAMARQLPALVAEETWLARGRQLLADLQRLRMRAA
jgi:spore maturation protein CgeB